MTAFTIFFQILAESAKSSSSTRKTAH